MQRPQPSRILRGMTFNWAFYIDLGLIGFALLFATLIRSKVRFFQRFLIPNALTAGFLLLPFYNFVAPRIGLGEHSLGPMVYHLLSLSFVGMTLRAREPAPRTGDRRILATAISILSQFGVQALIGLLFTFVLMNSVMPGLFPSFGFLLPLGFAQGPGQAYAIGRGWESFGFTGAGSVGLTFAAIGFIFASFGGVYLINVGIRKGWLKEEFVARMQTTAVKGGVYPRGAARPVAAEMTTESEAIDSVTYHVALIGVVYLLSYLLLQGITVLLSLAGNLGRDLAVNLWGISYIFAALMGIIVKTILSAAKVEHTIDNRTMTRISGLAVDLMVAASIGAISIPVVQRYLGPIVALSILGGLSAFLVIPWFCSRIFTDHQFHRTMMIFGVSTGTLPTGLALLRVLDPEFETPVASDYMYASGLTFLMAIPFILAINLPVYAHTTGDMLYFWLAVAVAVGYILFSLLGFVFVAKKRAITRVSEVWLHEQ